MSGRTPAQARERFLAPLRRCLSCITNAQIIVSAIGKPGEPEALTLSQDPVRVRTRHNIVYQLRLRQQFHLVLEGRDWRVTTDAYQYRLDDGTGLELASWHWHPSTGNPHPHLHVTGAPAGGGTHLPTGRVSIESVLRLLLVDLGARPRPPTSPTSRKSWMSARGRSLSTAAGMPGGEGSRDLVTADRARSGIIRGDRAGHGIPLATVPAAPSTPRE
jgi:hypothetical protein